MKIGTVTRTWQRSALVAILAATGVAGCGDDEPKPAVTPTATVEPDSGETEEDAATDPTATAPGATSASPSVSSEPTEPDTGASTTPEAGPAPVEAGPVEAGHTEAGATEAGAAHDAGDGGAGDGGGNACYASSDFDPTVDHCSERFTGSCGDAGGGSELMDLCMTYNYNFSAGVIDAALACWDAAEVEECSEGAVAQFKACFETASAGACPQQFEGCQTLATNCSEMTVEECNAAVSAVNDDWAPIVGYAYCYDMSTGDGCRDIFLDCRATGALP